LRYDDSLVGSLAVLVAILAACVAIGPWTEPYELRSFAAIRARFGKSVARGVWFAIAVALFASGYAILNGIRPGYAVPSSSVGVPQVRD
jgi:hypothetical protein